MTRYLLLFDSYGLVFCGATSCWPLPAQSFSGPSPLGLATIFYSLRFETSHFVPSYDSQGHGGGIRPRLHTGWIIEFTNEFSFITWGEPTREHYLQQFIYWSVLSVSTEIEDSSVCIATGYSLDDRGSIPDRGKRFFRLPCLDRLWDPPGLLFSGYPGLFPGTKAAGAWSWPLTSI
jgi:hypothetical protein